MDVADRIGCMLTAAGAFFPGWSVVVMQRT
jgi:hypothetical protein